MGLRVELEPGPEGAVKHFLLLLLLLSFGVWGRGRWAGKLGEDQAGRRGKDFVTFVVVPQCRCVEERRDAGLRP